MKEIFSIVGVLIVVGAVIGGVLYVTFPVAMTTYGGMGLNFLRSLSSPAGTLTVETNPAYKAPVAAGPSPPLADAAWPNAAVGDWPSYNRTPTSQRFSPLDQINAKNVGNLKVLCTYDLGVFAAFESGLIMVNNALIGTSEYDIFSINPATCAENWRTRLDYPGALLPANRGAAYMDGLLFRGTQDCRVLAFDFKTGERVRGDDDLRHETWRDSAGGANRLGRPRLRRQCRWRLQGWQGQRIRARGKTGKIVWQFFLVPQVQGDVVRGPLGKSPLDAKSWNNAPGIPISGGGAWTSYTLDIKNGLLYVPGGNPAPGLRLGSTRRRESLHRLGRGARRQDRRLQEPLQGREKGLA